METYAMIGDPSLHSTTPIQAPAKPYHRQRQPETFLPSDLVSRLVTAEGPEAFLPPGWSFSAYDADLQHHYTIPSHQVTANSASLKYTLLHERYGQGTRYRFQLCTKYLEGRCEEGKHCAFLHATCDALAEKQVVHVNENLADCTTTQDVVNSQKRPRLNAHHYRLLPAGRTIAVHAPNAVDEPPQLFESGSVLYTQGGLAAYRLSAQSESASDAIDAIPAARGSRPRHCAHFQFRKVCHAGEECLFVHSLAPYVQPRFRRPLEEVQTHTDANLTPDKPNCPPTRDRTGRNAPAKEAGRPASRASLPDYTEHLRRIEAPPSAGVVFTPYAANAQPSSGVMVAFLPPSAMVLPCAAPFGAGVPIPFPYAYAHPYPMLGGLSLGGLLAPTASSRLAPAA